MKKGVLFLLLILFLIWLYRKEKNNSVPQAKETIPTPETKIVYVSNEIPTSGSIVKEFSFTGLTDQTFTHNLARFVHATVIVGGEEVDVHVSYPDLNTVRIQSNSIITGTLIIH